MQYFFLFLEKLIRVRCEGLLMEVWDGDWGPVVDAFIEASVAIAVGYFIYAAVVVGVVVAGFVYGIFAMKVVGSVLLAHLVSASALLLLVEPKSNRLDTFIEVYTLPVSLASLLIATAILILRNLVHS
jgi:hypothetical protein